MTKRLLNSLMQRAGGFKGVSWSVIDPESIRIYFSPSLGYLAVMPTRNMTLTIRYYVSKKFFTLGRVDPNYLDLSGFEESKDELMNSVFVAAFGRMIRNKPPLDAEPNSVTDQLYWAESPIMLDELVKALRQKNS